MTGLLTDEEFAFAIRFLEDSDFAANANIARAERAARLAAEKERDAARAEVARLREALVDYADTYCEFSRDFEGCGKLNSDACGGCRARAALATPSPEPAGDRT